MNTARARWAVAAGAALALGLTACAPPSTDPTPAPTAGGLSGTLEVVSYHPENTPLYDRLAELAEQFEAQHDGLTVEITFGGGPGMPPIMTRYLAGDAPDVNPTLGGQCPNGELIEGGLTYDLSDALKSDFGDGGTWEDAIHPAVRSQLDSWVDDSVCMAPESVTVIQFFYNKKIFAEHGLSVPETIDDLIETAAALKSAGQTPFAVTGTFAFYMQLYWDYLMLRHVGAEAYTHAIGGAQVTREPIPGERPLLADLPGVRDAARDLERLVSDGNILDGFRSTDFTAAQMSFFQGDAAMILMGSWLVSEMADAIPEDFEVGTFAFPVATGGAGDQATTIGGVQGLSVAADAKNPEAAIEWLKFIGQADVQATYASEFGAISGYKAAPAPEGFEAVVDMLADGEMQMMYFGLLGQSAEIQAAIHEPLTQLFFGQIGADEMVTQMSQRLDAANG
ncbi:MAG: carbohydrate ABC transporter substrate-binding protein [Microbacteriaceae bacterium]|nr:MAG: carbohydrate ABC transporter substrate-binding protein [Microbacteriaceae bacterium]